MKTIRVVAAVIRAVNNENKPVIFATQRGYGEFKGGWEFPGGKVESGETPQQALKDSNRSPSLVLVTTGSAARKMAATMPGGV